MTKLNDFEMNNELIIELPYKRLKYVEDALDVIAGSEIIAYDTETTGLNIRTDTVIGIGVANELLQSAYVPLWEWRDGSLHHTGTDPLPVLEALRSKKIIAHNSLFDLEMTKNNLKTDLWGSLYLDTVMLIHTVRETGPFGLKPHSKLLWGVDELTEQKEMQESIKANGGGKKGEIYKADSELIGKYCAKDCELTMRLMQHYLPILKQEGLEEFFFTKEVMPLYKGPTRTMVTRGIPVDLPLLQKAKSDIQETIHHLEGSIQYEIKEYVDGPFEKWLFNKDYPPCRSGEFAQMLIELSDCEVQKTKSGSFSMTEKALQPHKAHKFIDYLLGGPYLTEEQVRDVQAALWVKNGTGCRFNLSSKHHLKKLFFEHYGEIPISTTDLGNPQIDDDTLEVFSKKYAWVKYLQMYNKLIKIRGTYIEKILEDQEDGILYPKWLQHGTTSGRFSGDLQQLPRKVKGSDTVSNFTNMIRDFLIAGPGNKLVGADFSQLEVCVFGADAQDPVLLEAIRNKEDVYSKVAIEMYKLTQYSASKNAPNYLKDKAPEVRERVKPVVLGIRYGLEAFKLSHDKGISQEEAQGMIDLYFKTLPVLKKRMDTIREEVSTSGVAVSEGGRIRHLPEVVEFVKKYGKENLDPLVLWKNYNGTSKYESLKKERKLMKHLYNLALNHPIQSMAASIVNRSAVAIQDEFERLGMSAYMTIQVHDEIVCHCPEEEADAVSRIMRDKMENTVKISVPLEAVPVIGSIYGELK